MLFFFSVTNNDWQQKLNGKVFTEAKSENRFPIDFYNTWSLFATTALYSRCHYRWGKFSYDNAGNVGEADWKWDISLDF